MKPKVTPKFDFLLDEFDDAIESEQEEIFSNPKLAELQHKAERYTQADFIDEGGMKIIESYQDSVTGRSIAMAQMRQCESQQELEYFINEARISALLEHPNIIPVYDIGTTPENKPYFTMKRLGGENLRSVLKKLQLNDKKTLAQYPLPEIVDIFLKICDAISYAHSRGIVHLDIKPANIQVDEYGQVQVCDWGLARRLSTQGQVDETLQEFNENSYQGLYISKTLDGSCKGTPGFMAPEQISEIFGLRSVKTDIYSLGALLYTLLSHQDIFSGNDVQQQMQETIKGNIKPLLSHGVEIDKSLVAVVEKALSRNPEDRYTDVLALASDIRAFRNGFATGAEEAGISKRLLLIMKRHKDLVCSFLVFSIMICVLVISFIYSLNQEKNRAQNSESSALRLAEKLNLEQKEKKKLSLSAAPQIYTTAKLYYEKFYYNKSMTYTETALQLDPSLEPARILYATLLAGNLQYEESLAQINKLTDKNKYQWLADFCERIRVLNSETTRIKIDDLYLVYRDLYHPPFHLTDHLARTISYRYSVQDRLDFAKLFFTEFNKNPYFKYQLTPQGKHYKLSLKESRGILTLRELHDLPISELDLSGTSFTTLKYLDGLSLKKLNLANSNLANLDFLWGCKNLEELDIRNSRVYDLDKLQYTSIHTLILGSNPVNLFSLKYCKTLKKITLPRGIYKQAYLELMKLDHLVEYSD